MFPDSFQKMTQSHSERSLILFAKHRIYHFLNGERNMSLVFGSNEALDSPYEESGLQHVTTVSIAVEDALGHSTY